MTKECAITPPDFRNLGVLLRAALAAQALGMMAALLLAQSVSEVGPVFLTGAAYLQPPLLATLLAWFTLSPWLAALPRVWAEAMRVATAAGCAALWLTLLAPERGDAVRAALLAAGAAGTILVWLDWRNWRLSPALADARLQALQARIRPHFLFNSLNSVLSLMRSQPRQAETALENLAELYRALMADNQRLSPLARELELARAYVELEALRLGERLGVDWRVDGAPDDALLPALVLQPLLENAVIHGIEPNPAGGRIGVDIFVRGDSLGIVVRNPVCAAEGGARRGNGMALGNIRERLALHFDAEARLSARTVGDEFVVQMVMPLRRGEAAP
jgi:two-component system sensor histidine kinase AlgZ